MSTNEQQVNGQKPSVNQQPAVKAGFSWRKFSKARKIVLVVLSAFIFIIAIWLISWSFDVYRTNTRNKPAVPSNPAEYFSIADIAYDEQNNIRLSLNVFKDKVGLFSVIVDEKQQSDELRRICQFYIKNQGFYVLDQNLCNYGRTGGDPIEPLYPWAISDPTIEHRVKLCTDYGCQEKVLEPKMKKEVIIRTDKTEYQLGETVKVTLTNNLDTLFKIKNIQQMVEGVADLEKKTENGWEKMSLIIVPDIFPVKELLPGEIHIYEWDQSVFLGGTTTTYSKVLPGIYRFKFTFDQVYSVYSNEFEIKEINQGVVIRTIKMHILKTKL